MSNFPTDRNIMQAMFAGQLDVMVETVCRDNSNDFQTRQQAANSVISLRGHVVNRKDVVARGRGIIGKCTRCKYKIFVPYNPGPDEWGIYGNLVELNCPYAVGTPQNKPSNMTPDLWGMFKQYIGAIDMDSKIEDPESE